MPRVRPESPGDLAAVREVNSRAFDGAVEADLVDALRAAGAAPVSLVAEVDGAVVGHILFSPMTFEDAPAFRGRVVALGPMAVLPGHQRRGIGGALVEAGLAACTATGATAVFVLGHPEYYPRFGFVPAEDFGLRSVYDVPHGVFMARELVPGALADARGLVRYHAAFEGA